MPKVQIVAEIDQDLNRQVEIAAADSDRSVSEWIEGILRREVQRESLASTNGWSRNGLPPEFNMPYPGAKPRGSRNPPKLRGTGGTVADAVIEDRR